MKEQAIKMLSIDDKSLTTSLDKAGYREKGIQVISASNSSDAMDALESKNIEIIVINLDFLGNHAAGICQTVRKNESWKEIPIIVTSVQAGSSFKNDALKAGANIFVEQPIPRSYFVEKIKQLLEKATRGKDRVAQHDIGFTKFIYDDKEHEFSIGDLSASGMLVSTDTEIASGQECLLEFHLPIGKKPVKIEGKVVRILKADPKFPERKSGLGIRFCNFQGDSKKRLDKYLEKQVAKGDQQMLYYL